MRILALIIASLFILCANTQVINVSSDLSLWTLSGGWSFNNNYLEYVTNANPGYAIAEEGQFSTGLVYTLSFQLRVISGSGVFQIGFGTNSSNFQSFYVESLPVPATLSKDDDNDADNIAQNTTINVQFEYTQNANASLILSILSTQIDVQIYAVSFSIRQAYVPPVPQCNEYIGFTPFQITKLLASRTATLLDGQVNDVVQRLNHLRTKVIAGGLLLTRVLDYGLWIDVINSFNEGTVCKINIRDFDLYNWLINHQINYALNKYHGDALQRKQKKEPYFGRTFLKAPVFKRSLIDTADQESNIF